MLHHGMQRVRDAEELAKAGIVITTFSTVETEFRRQQSGFVLGGEKKKVQLICR